MRELRYKVKDFSDKEKFVVLLMDEMKIQKNLVWNKHNIEVIGYVDLSDIDLNYATLSKVTTVASYALVLLIRSIVNTFKPSLVHFATDGILASQMLPLLWKGISKCEKSSLKVIVVTCDDESPNRKLFRMHCHLTRDDDMNPETDVTYRTRNLFSGTENRFLYFISDVPYLLKIARSSLLNSGSGSLTRYMWNVFIMEPYC